MAKKELRKAYSQPEAISAPAMATEPAQELIEFDVWHVMRNKMIPGHHMKEIIKADFKGRGLGDKETLATFDKALANYGVKL